MDSRFKAVLVTGILVTLGCQTCVIAQHGRTSGRSPAELVQLLGHDSFQTRLRAQRVLHKQGPTKEVTGALLSGLKSHSLEIRESSRRLLKQFDLQKFDRELGRLNSPHVDSADVKLAGWNEFSQLAGNDLWARRLYAKIIKKHYSLIRKLIRQAPAAAQDRFLADVDPYRLPTADSVSWAMLLFCDSLETDLRRPDLSSRILNSLSHSGLGPSRTTGGDRLVIERLVGRWLENHLQVGIVRDRLLVAMRYRRHQLASQLCTTTLADYSATASAQSTAMLCATVLGHEDLRDKLIQRLDDHRTAHVWQLIASRQTKIRTQVRDVALALLLYQQGMDPRKFGYMELQADPLMLYRDHSLGFADDTSREAAHQLAREQLGLMHN